MPSGKYERRPEVCSECSERFKTKRELGYHKWSKHKMRGTSYSSKQNWRKKDSLQVQETNGELNDKVQRSTNAEEVFDPYEGFDPFITGHTVGSVQASISAVATGEGYDVAKFTAWIAELLSPPEMRKERWRPRKV